MSELENFMPGKVMTFRGESSDALTDATALIEVTDTANGDIEFVFDIPNPKCRVYVRVPQADVRRVLDALEPTA